MRRTPQSRALFERGRRVLPGGDTRTGTFYLPYPLFVARGEGCHLWDADGHQYLDVLNNFTSLVHGHGHTAVVRAIADQAGQGHGARHRQRPAGRPGRGAVPAGAVGRAAALLQLGHRGDDGGAARRQGVHRPAEDPEDGRLLPRLARPGGGGGLAALRRRAAGLVAGRGRRSDRRRVQRPRSHRGAHPRAPRRAGRGHRRADAPAPARCPPITPSSRACARSPPSAACCSCSTR